MTPLRIVSLILLAALFAVWAGLMFATLFKLRRRASERTGQVFPGPRAALSEWGVWLRAPQDRKSRRWLIGTTVALMIWIISQAVMAA